MGSCKLSSPHHLFLATRNLCCVAASVTSNVPAGQKNSGPSYEDKVTGPSTITEADSVSGDANSSVLAARTEERLGGENEPLIMEE